MGGRAWFHVGLSTFMLLALGAFGGGGDAGDFRSEADEICADGAKQVIEVQNELGPAQSLEDDVALTEEQIPLREETLSQLEDLDPPKSLQSDYEEFLSLLGDRIANDEAFLEAAAAGDQAAIDSLGANLEEIFDQRHEVGRDLGFYACAERLPRKEEKKVRAVIEKTTIKGDPDFCTEKYTENYVEAVGGLEACETAESDPANAADSVEVEDVFGMARVYAHAVVTPEGGPNDQAPGEFDLLYQDGVYKREAIYAV